MCVDQDVEEPLHKKKKRERERETLLLYGREGWEWSEKERMR